MTRLNLSRLRRVRLPELAWRTREAAAIVRERVEAAASAPGWNRRHLCARLVADSSLTPAREHLRAGQPLEAHRALTEWFAMQPTRFLIGPSFRDELKAQINARFPDAAGDACLRGVRILNGRYDLLGYRDVPFARDTWHFDPIHNAEAPRLFWSQVPYLEPSCGDHKVIWEFNRHQHWLELGRAYWLTGDTRYRRECLAQLSSWLSANPPLVGVNWASMLELAFRTLSWIWALHFFADPALEDDTPWTVDLLLGLDRQLTHVERHLSYYFSPNTHLLGEALALYVAGRALPMLAASARRERTGRRVLLQEIERQVAPDGGHCERSPHYHRYTLDFYLLALAIARITNDPTAGVFERAVARLARAARALADDSGRLPHIGDDDGGSLLPICRRSPDDVRDSLAIAAALTGQVDVVVDEAPEEMFWFLGHPRFADAVSRVAGASRSHRPGSAALPETGYYVSRTRCGDHLVIDGGAHGYLNCGHAHADALSLTFTHRRKALLIDPGTACYTIDLATRDRFRSTALHNTLTLDGQSQSIPRGPFHWARTADAITRRWHMNRRFDYFAGLHEGYAPVQHHRHVLMLHDDLLLVADCLAAGALDDRGDTPNMHEVAVHWHVDPRWSVHVKNGGALLESAAGRIQLYVSGGTITRYTGDATTGLGWHSPAYGSVEPATTLRIKARGQLPRWIVSAFGLDPTNRIEQLSLAPVEAATGMLHHTTAMRIIRERTVDCVVIAEPHDDRRPCRWRAFDFESDAALCYSRQAGDEIEAIAVVDASLLESRRFAHVRLNYATRMSDAFLDFSHHAIRVTSNALAEA